MAQMRALVLLCDPEMEPAMLDFVEDYTEVLVLFRLTVPHVLKAAIENILGPDARFTVRTCKGACSSANDASRTP